MYTVIGYECGHMMDPEEHFKWTVGAYPTYEEARQIAEKVIASTVRENQGITAEELMARWSFWGDCASISPGPPPGTPWFDGFEYARRVAEEEAERRQGSGRA